ncbi:LysR family transcriptional regulator, partial [Xanthomonas sp. Kuri4-2]
RILDEAGAARAELSQHSGRVQGRLRLSLPLVSDLVLPLLSDFMQAYPQVLLDLDFTDCRVDVVEEGFDAVLRVGEPGDSRLTARRIGRFRRCLVASPDYLARHGTPHAPADLQAHRCLRYRYPSSGKLEAWPLRGTESEPAASESMVCNTVEAQVCFARRGSGIAYVPEHSVRTALADGSLVRLLDGAVDDPGTFYLLWPSGRHMLPKLRVFIDFVDQRLLREDRGLCL